MQPTSHQFFGFEKLCEWIVHLALNLEHFQGQLDVAGITASKIPEFFEAHKVLKTFEQEREERGFKFASWNQRFFTQRVLDESAKQLSTPPTDIALLRPMFLEHYKHYRAMDLASRVSSDPTQVDRFVDSYLMDTVSEVKVYSLKEAHDEFLVEHERLQKEGSIIFEIPRFEKLSQAIGGFNPKRLILLLADSGFGKTTLALNLTSALAGKCAVLFLNMEMGNYDFFKRIVAIEEGRTYKELNREIITQISDFYKTKQMFYTDGKSLSMSQIGSLAKLYKKKHDIKFIVVDYDQKIKFENDSVEQWKQLQKASGDLEEMAKELNVCIILCAQRNRDGQISGSFRSTFSASTVLQFTQDELHDTCIYTIKNRFGQNGAGVLVHYDREKSQITETHDFIRKPDTKVKKAI
jgi:KaiC/GvpD/RAD55 family RecA-like ATPase